MAGTRIGPRHSVNQRSHGIERDHLVAALRELERLAPAAGSADQHARRRRWKIAVHGTSLPRKPFRPEGAVTGLIGRRGTEGERVVGVEDVVRCERAHQTRAEAIEQHGCAIDDQRARDQAGQRAIDRARRTRLRIVAHLGLSGCRIGQRTTGGIEAHRDLILGDRCRRVAERLAIHQHPCVTENAAVATPEPNHEARVRMGSNEVPIGHQAALETIAARRGTHHPAGPVGEERDSPFATRVAHTRLRRWARRSARACGAASHTWRAGRKLPTRECGPQASCPRVAPVRSPPALARARPSARHVIAPPLATSRRAVPATSLSASTMPSRTTGRTSSDGRTRSRTRARAQSGRDNAPASSRVARRRAG